MANEPEQPAPRAPATTPDPGATTPASTGTTAAQTLALDVIKPAVPFTGHGWDQIPTVFGSLDVERNVAALLSAATRPMTDQIARQEQQIERLEAKLDELRDRNNSAERERDVLRSRVKSLRADSIYQQIMLGLGTSIAGGGIGIAIVDTLSTWALVMTGIGLALTIATIYRATRT